MSPNRKELFGNKGPAPLRALAGSGLALAVAACISGGVEPPPAQSAYEYPECDDPEDPSSLGTVGCPCKDLNIFKMEDVLDEDGSPDGAGSYLANGLRGLGQYCIDGTGSDERTPVVCGKIHHNDDDYPVCLECGVGTNVGCPCNSDAECQGAENDLACWGSEEHGWAASPLPGTCLPSANTEAGREALQDLRWFCLDNCGSIDTTSDGRTACLYNQIGNLPFDHGTCVDFLAYCGEIEGVCELEGLMCRYEDDECRMECMSDDECVEIGFPPHYGCDFLAGFEEGHCVPQECLVSANSEPDYCYLFR